MADTDYTVEDILNAYCMGLFPMADDAQADEIHWYDPQLRGQLSLDHLHVPERLRRTLLRAPFTVRVDTDFEGVIDGCAARDRTWINRPIRRLFIDLHHAGFAHSVECWRDGQLVGGLYGLALGGVFAGESMFSRATDASKVALVHLCARLWKGGFSVLDTQFINPHLLQFGVYEIKRADYKKALRKALPQDADFWAVEVETLSELTLITEYLDFLKFKSCKT